MDCWQRKLLGEDPLLTKKILHILVVDSFESTVVFELSNPLDDDTAPECFENLHALFS